MDTLQTQLTPRQRERLLRLAKSFNLKSSAASLPPIPRVERGEQVPLSFAQHRLWFLAQMEGASEAYHIPMGLRLTGELDRDALKRALTRIAGRHEALRTTFHQTGGQPVQTILEPRSGFVLQERDLSGHQEKAVELGRWMKEEVIRRFDLEHGPLIRGQLIRLGAQEHVLLITMHHIISDGWSLGVFTNELSALYQAYCAGEEDPLPPLVTQYADYAIWQRQRLSEEMLQREGDYWRSTLAGAPALLELPTDRPRPAQQTFAGDGVELQLDAALTRRLKTLSQRHGMTLYMLMVAGWAAVLSRLSGQEEVVIGTAIANRPRPEVEGLIGLFMNTQALRVEVSGRVTELLQKVKARILEAQAHQELPFEQVVEVVKPTRNLAHAPIFQVMFVWQGDDDRTVDLPGLTVTPAQITYSVAKFDLELDLGEVGGRVAGSLRYATALFNRETVARHAGYLQQSLAAMVADESQAVERIALLSDAERHQLLVTWNDTQVAYEKDRCIHELFEAAAEKTPNAIAVAYEQQTLTYSELNRQATRLAHYLRSLGVKPDDRVALCAERSLEMVVGILAIVKAGGAYLPLDPVYPVERLEYMLKDSSPVVLLVHLSSAVRMELNTLLTTSLVPVVDLEADARSWVDGPEINIDPKNIGLKPHHLAYVIYTSGSTGKPKGVMVEHSNVVRLFSATEDWFHFDRTDVWTLFHSYAFDFSVWEIWGALIYGGKLVVVPQVTTRSPQDFLSLLCAEGVTILNQTPSAFRQLVAAQADNITSHHLRHVIFGGEALEVSSLRPWYEREINRETRLINMYGITETTVHVTYRPLEQGYTTAPGSSPIGRRIPDLTIYILDKHRQPVPIGVAGELYVGGAGVARGYLNRPELTRERFMVDPFSANPRARMYRSGDVGYFRADGNIEYLGRNDQQVKIRGFRIELGEIEARLTEHPSVSEAVVVAREDQAGDKRLVAYITPARRTTENDSTTEIDVEALRGYLSSLLPDYMVPAAYVRLESFPLTTNGKLDRKALPAPDTDAYATRGYEAPVGEVESTIARVWSEVLKLERVGRNDNFFELGGHSLLAMPLIERMRQAGLPVGVRALFSTPTLKDLAEAAGTESREIAVPPNLIPEGSAVITPEMLPLVSLSQDDINRIVASVPGGAANVQDIYPLAPLQEGILFHHLLGKEGDVYLTATLLGAPTRERLEDYAKALQVVIHRHDILRTAVVWEGLPEPVQVVWRHAPMSVEEVTLDPAAGDIAQQLHARFDPRHYRLDIRQAPLWRLFIAQDVPNNRWVMLELTHHLVDDNTSIGILLGEMQAILQGQVEQLPPPLPFRNFVAQARLGVSREEHEAFFTRLLGDVDEPTAPFGLTDVQGDGNHIAEGKRLVDADLSQRLRSQARALGVSVATLFHLAWALVLARTSRRNDVVFGTVMFGRMQGLEGAERAMGIFINTLPVRIKVEDEPVRESVRKTHELLTQLLRHEHAPLALAQRCSSVQAPAPLFSSLLNYRHIGDEAASAELGSKSTQTMVGVEFLSGQERTNYPFGLAVNDLGKNLSLYVKVDKSIDAEQVCELMHTALTSLVEALENEPEKALRSLSVLPAVERELLVYGWNQTDANYPASVCVHELFEQQVERTPELRAVAWNGVGLSYRELNRRANQLAHYLRRHGVGPEERVGICMKRGVEMIVGLLGIMKAGGAYVGLDTRYPEERLRYMVEDSGAKLVVTQREAAELLRASQTRLVCMDEEEERARMEGESEQNLISAAGVEQLAYVIYTSGSTGKPKGVGIEQRQLVNYLRGITKDLQEVGLGQGSKYAMVSTLSADLGNTAIYGALVTGGELHVIGEDYVMDGERMGEYCEREQIDCLKIVPSHLEGLRGAKGGEKVLPTKVAVVGGEALPWKWVREWKKLSGCAVINHYGPTEVTIGGVRFRVVKETDGAPGEEIVPIGQMLGNVRGYVVDKEMEPTPLGVPGELYIGGSGVGRGYVNRPELTAERFVPDPFAGNGQRLYRSGDLVRWRKDRNLEFLGRIDQQVKIRGFRIELGEIEAVLREQEGIKQAAVVVAEGENREKRLVAYITTAGAAENTAGAGTIDVETLRARLKLLLPDYMVPAAYVLLEKLPLNANGKVDRKALPAPEGGVYAARGYEAPLGEVEIAIAQIWAQVLKIERAGRSDNFFELGGHSLLAMNVVERMRRAGLPVDVRALFAAPILKDLAEAVGGESRAIAVPPNLIPAGTTVITPEMLPLVSLSQGDINKIVNGVPGGAANIQDIYPLAPLQEGILFHHLLGKQGDVYLTATLLGAPTRECVDQYVKVLEVLIHRHDIMRTAVVWEGLPEPVQVVWRHAPVSIEEVTFDPAAGDITKQLHARFDPRHYRLDIRQAPLWRLFIAQDVPNNRWVILELTHHLIADNTSGRFLLDEIEAILQGHAEHLPAPLPFRNFVAQARLGVSREEHEAFFTRLLADVDEPTAPFGLTDVQGDGTHIMESRRMVDAELTQRLRSQARTLGVSVATMFHLAWALVLARTSHRNDVVFGTVMFGRMQGMEGTERAMGIFINTLPVRIKVGDDHVRESVRKTHELLTQLLRHEHAPLALAQRCSSVQAPAPLFTSLLNYRHTGEEPESAEQGSKRVPMEGLEFLGGEERTNYPFLISIDDSGQGLNLIVQVEASIGSQRVCDLMHTALQSLVKALESAPESAVGSLRVLPEEERQKVLYAWNATDAEYPQEKCIHELFEEQAKRTPQAAAVMFKNCSMNYQELNHRANQLAHYLRSVGVKPDERVGICLERGVEMIVALLAVLKAGGAYVPLDPAYPEERLLYMIKDSRPVAVLAQSSTVELVKRVGNAIQLIELNGDTKRWAQQAQTNPERIHTGLTPAHLAYVIYTSGSTGTPKGVMLEHRNTVNLICWAQQCFSGDVLARTLFSTSLNFDLAVYECFVPLTSGASIRIVSNALDLAEGGVDVTLINTVPSVMKTLIEERAVPPAVQVVNLAGEPLKRTLAEAIFAATKAERLCNLYGPTETTTYSTWVEMKREDGFAAHIGRPIANTRVYMLDGDMEPVPVGVVGEIYIGGAGVGRGYLNRDDLTAQRFLRDPFVMSAEARMYRTGDLGKWLADGNIEYLGRNDFQVKIRGFRIELGEIEARLAEHPSVHEAVVLAREDHAGDKRLVAYVTARKLNAEGAAAGEMDVEALRAYLNLLLPEHMLPAAYVMLPKLPLTANGKLDRKALPSPDAGAYMTSGYEAPMGEVETTIARIWADALKLERVGRNDNFFRIGGHSLLVVKVTSLLRQHGIETTVAGLFNHPTIESLAASLYKASRNVGGRGAQRIREGTETPLFLVHDGYGDELYFSALGQYLPAELPVYGLPGISPDESRLRTMGEMATRMASLLQQVQPAGPYRLAGWSFGGVLAYEIAQQLLDQGHAVEFLGLMDAVCPGGLGVEDNHEKPPEAILAELCEEQRVQKLLEGSPVAPYAVPNGSLGFDELFNHFKALRMLPENFQYLAPDEARARCRNLELYSRAMVAYHPRPISIPVHLFVAGERPPGSTAPTTSLGWERCVPARLLNTQAVPGNHQTMMRPPHIQALAQRLVESLANPDERCHSEGSLSSRAFSSARE